MNIQIPTLNITIDEKELKERIQRDAERLLREQSSAYFQNERKIDGKIYQEKGIGSLYIEQEFDKLLQDYQTSGKLKNMIEKAFEKALDSAIADATNHAARKLAFSKIKLED